MQKNSFHLPRTARHCTDVNGYNLESIFDIIRLLRSLLISYFEQIIQHHRSLERYMILGEIEGKRRKIDGSGCSDNH